MSSSNQPAVDDAFPFTFQHEASAKVITDAPEHTTDYRLWCQLTSAFEGGSNYWIQGAAVIDEDKTGGKEGIYLQDWPFLGATVLIIVIEDPGETKRPPHAKGIWRLDREALVQGAKVMASLELGKGGHHWHDVVQDNGDAITGDVFLQCCLFGEIVFG